MLVDPDLFRLYLAAAAVLVLIPGPDTLLVLARGVGEGRRAGLIATAGITVGNLVHAMLAAVGISALIAASPMLFDALRLGGAAYLVWMGLKALRAAAAFWSARDQGSIPALPPSTSARIFANAMATNLLNPKVILFNLAFLPQFVSPAIGSVAGQMLILGMTLSVLGCIYLGLLAMASAGLGQTLFSSARVRAGLDGAAGLLFLGFAVRLFLTERKAA